MSMLTRPLRYVVLLLLGAVWILPLYLVLINSATSPAEYRKKAVYAAPKSFAFWDNVTAAWDAVNLGTSIGSTLFYATVGGILAVFFGSLAAFAIVNLRIKRGFLWFMLIYAGTIFPFQMYLAPLYTSYVRFNLYDTRQGLLIFYTAIAIPFAVFVVRNHFTSIPFDITEAAKIDGASPFRVYAQIYLPLSVNAFLTVFILQFTWIWNDLLFGLTLSKSANIRPIMTALAGLQGQYASASIPVVLAGALIVSIPTFILFFSVQRIFVRGLSVTGS
jgi:multiple sugar transport system permease protein